MPYSKGALREAIVPHQPFRDELSGRRRTTLVLFYLAALLSVIASSLAGRILPFRTPLLVLAVVGAGAAILFLLRFLLSTDEHDQQSTFRALPFAFPGTLVFSPTIAFLHSFGFRPVSCPP